MTDDRPGWRTGDLPGPVLVLGYLVGIVAVLALASTGSWIGVLAMVAVMAVMAGTIVLWSDSPS